jgi:hypothetical protein
MTKIYDPKNMTLKGDDQGESSPYLQAFDHSVNLFAQSKNISKEEALIEALKEFEKVESA